MCFARVCNIGRHITKLKRFSRWWIPLEKETSYFSRTGSASSSITKSLWKTTKLSGLWLTMIKTQCTVSDVIRWWRILDHDDVINKIETLLLNHCHEDRLEKWKVSFPLELFIMTISSIIIWWNNSRSTRTIPARKVCLHVCYCAWTRAPHTTCDDREIINQIIVYSNAVILNPSFSLALSRFILTITMRSCQCVMRMRV